MLARLAAVTSSLINTRLKWQPIPRGWSTEKNSCSNKQSSHWSGQDDDLPRVWSVASTTTPTLPLPPPPTPPSKLQGNLSLSLSNISHRSVIVLCPPGPAEINQFSAGQRKQLSCFENKTAKQFSNIHQMSSSAFLNRS